MSFARLLLAIEFGLNGWLLGCLVSHKHYLRFPVFTGFIAFCTVAQAIMFPLYYRERWHEYATLWKWSESAGEVLMLGICGELTIKVIRRTAGNCEALIGAGVFASVFLSALVTPAAMANLPILAFVPTASFALVTVVWIRVFSAMERMQ